MARTRDKAAGLIRAQPMMLQRPPPMRAAAAAEAEDLRTGASFRLTCDTMTATRSIHADGGPVTDGPTANAGSGGSVWRTVTSYSGTGILSARGGNGGTATTSGDGGGYIRLEGGAYGGTTDVSASAGGQDRLIQ
jgi:hypothetical protein